MRCTLNISTLSHFIPFPFVNTSFDSRPQMGRDLQFENQGFQAMLWKRPVLGPAAPAGALSEGQNPEDRPRQSPDDAWAHSRLSSFALEHETAEEDLSSELNLDKECASKSALFKGALSFHWLQEATRLSGRRVRCKWKFIFCFINCTPWGFH